MKNINEITLEIKSKILLNKFENTNVYLKKNDFLLLVFIGVHSWLTL